MRQLPLDVRLADYARFDTFYEGRNAEAVHELQAVLDRPPQRVVWLWGSQESGKSHLLQALLAEADQRGLRSAWLPLAEFKESGMDPEMLEGMGAFELVCIDDVDRIAGDDAWERAVFRLFEELSNQNARLVVSASVAPKSAAFNLPDLQSRMNWGGVLRLQSLSDEDSIGALKKRASHRGLELPDDTAAYLLSRVNRSPRTLFSLLDRLDQEALVAQRRLTIPFVRQVIETG